MVAAPALAERGRSQILSVSEAHQFDRGLEEGMLASGAADPGRFVLHTRTTSEIRPGPAATARPRNDNGCGQYAYQAFPGSGDGEWAGQIHIQETTWTLMGANRSHRPVSPRWSEGRPTPGLGVTVGPSVAVTVGPSVAVMAN